MAHYIIDHEKSKLFFCSYFSCRFTYTLMRDVMVYFVNLLGHVKLWILPSSSTSSEPGAFLHTKSYAVIVIVSQSPPPTLPRPSHHCFTIISKRVIVIIINVVCLVVPEQNTWNYVLRKKWWQSSERMWDHSTLHSK